MSEIMSISDALKRYEGVMNLLGWKMVAHYPRNYGRHYLCKFFDIYNSKRTLVNYLVYQRNWFMEYENVFPNEAGKGMGATINYSILKTLVAEKVDYLVFATPIGKFFQIKPKKALDYVEEHKTIRQQEKGEITSSFPVSLMQLII
jgi:hypothetical protein